MPRTVIRPAARQDLLDIGDYIALDDPGRAASFVDEIVATIAAIADRPKSFALRTELRPGLRAARHRSYLIFFEEAGADVDIVRVLHGARNLNRIFGN